MDTVLTKLSPRSNRPESCLWLEDSYFRLSRNGFTAGMPFAVIQRPGNGLILRKGGDDARNRVSSRGEKAILAIDSAWIARRFEGCDFLRVRLSYLSAIIVPRVLTAAVIRQGVAATITGNLLEGVGRSVEINTPRPAVIPFKVCSLAARIDSLNLIFAMETITTARPEEVILSGGEATLAGAYLVDAGYTFTGANRYAL